MFKHYLEQ